MIRTTPHRKDALLIDAINDGQTSHAGFPSSFQDLCSRAMDRALGVEEVSLSAVVGLNSCLLDIYKNSFSLMPAFSDLLDTTAKNFSFYMDLQMSWLGLILPYAKIGSDALSHFAEQTVASSPGTSARSAGLERSADIAIGQEKAA